MGFRPTPTCLFLYTLTQNISLCRCLSSNKKAAYCLCWWIMYSPRISVSTAWYGDTLGFDGYRNIETDLFIRKSTRHVIEGRGSEPDTHLSVSLHNYSKYFPVPLSVFKLYRNVKSIYVFRHLSYFEFNRKIKNNRKLIWVWIKSDSNNLLPSIWCLYSYTCLE